LKDVGLLSDEKEELQSALRQSEDQIEDVRIQLYTAEEGLLTAQAERERLLTEKNDVSAALHRAEDSLAELELCMLQDERELSCDKSDGGDLAGLSKSELQSKCITLQDELQESESRVTSTASDVEQRARHVRRLEEDFAMMSDEITKLVDINGHFEQRLKEIKSAKERFTLTHVLFKRKQSIKKMVEGFERIVLIATGKNPVLTEELQFSILILRIRSKACGSRGRNAV
jgi:chromosome segregation ATPase